MVRLRLRVILLFILLFNFVSGKICNDSDLLDIGCSTNELCTKVDGKPKPICLCLPGFLRDVTKNDSSCLLVTNVSHYSSTPNSMSIIDNGVNNRVIAGILISALLIVFVICIFYLSYRYRLVSWVRYKISQRNSNYDEYMIGQDLDDDDDPPLP